MRLLESKSYDTEIWCIKEETKMTIEKILEIKNELENQGIINEPIMIDDSKFLKFFEELKEWLKWDIQRFPYKELDNPIGYRYGYRDHDLKFYNENYDLIVFSVMVGINICAKKGVLNDVRYTNATLGFSFTSFTALEDSYFYKNYQKVCGINTDILGYFVRGMIRNKMGNDTFDEFLVKYNNIIQKCNKISTPVVDKDGTIETTATPVVEPKYTPGSDGFMEQVKTKYGYIPVAYSALQCLWYMHQQTGQYRSKFVDYSKLDNCHDQKAVKLYIEHITRVMSMPKVYQTILQEMPELGTYINGNTIKFKIAGYNASKIGLLALKDNEHVLAIIYDMANDNAHVR